MTETSDKLERGSAAERLALQSGRATVLYALSQYYLFLPFAALCMAATIAHRPAYLWLTAMPFVLQIIATVAGNRLKGAYDRRPRDDDPAIWLRRYTILSGAVGGIWGFGAVVWFVPHTFPAQAYLCLAFLGMTATEFIVRAAYRPAYLAHAAASLGPLAVMLFIDGSSYAMLTSILVLFFGGVLYSYCEAIGKLIDESVRLRHDNVLLVVRLSQEKHQAEVARDAARASERAKSAFFATISHELRTPLNAILGMAQLLARSELEKTQRDYVKVLLEAGRGLTTLLDDVIDLARQENGTPKPPDEGCDTVQAVRTISRLLQPNAWQKQLRLSVNIAPDLPRVAADPRQLRRVLLKLVGNAVKFTEKGGVDVTLTPLNENGRDFVRFRIADTGPGVSPEIAPVLFDAFARADDSYARVHNGAGVGLAVAKRIVESMGGAIGYEHNPGAGCTFWFTVPASAPAAARDASAAKRTAPPAGLSLLTYVTDAAMRASLDRSLTPFGNRLVFTNTLAETIAAADREEFALIIVAGDGIDALASSPGQDRPVLAIVTNQAEQPFAADVVLRWPASPSALYAAIVTTGANADTQKTFVMPVQESAAEAALDTETFAELEKSFGLKTVIEILQAYLATAENLTKALANACEAQDWKLATRLAQDIAGAAGGLGLSALTSAARALAQASRDGKSPLSGVANVVLAEHRRTTEALQRLYPDLAA